jgi:hypothetical protein
VPGDVGLELGESEGVGEVKWFGMGWGWGLGVGWGGGGWGGGGVR